MAVSYSILSIARYEGLQKTRTLILSQAGYDVAKPSLTRGNRFLEGSLAFDLVLICHSDPEPSRLLLAAKVKALRPELPILMVAERY